MHKKNDFFIIFIFHKVLTFIINLWTSTLIVTNIKSWLWYKWISNAWSTILRKMYLNLFYYLTVCELMGRISQSMHFWLSIYNVHILLGNTCVEIGNCVILPISQSSNKWVNIFRVYLFDVLHYICLDIIGFFHHLLFDSLEKFFRLHQKWSFNTYMFFYVVFGKLVKGQWAHCHPYNLVPIITNPIHQFHVPVM